MPATYTDRLDGLTASVAIKAPVRAATTAQIDLEGLQSIDGISLASGDRVLVKDQDDASENGIYVVGSARWYRALDFDGARDAVGGTQIKINAGSTYTDSIWEVDGNGLLLIGTDDITFSSLTSRFDVGLRADLGSSDAGRGASLVFLENGSTVESWLAGQFIDGPDTAIIATQAKISSMWDFPDADYPVAENAKLWTDLVTWGRALSFEFDDINAPVNTPFAAPSSTLLIAAHNKGTDTTMCALQTIAWVHVDGKEASGVNFITASAANTLGVKLRGVEIDIQPGPGSTVADCFGLGILGFSLPNLGDGIYIEGLFGGYFSSGIRMGNINPTIGAGLYASGAMGALINSAAGTFGIDAILLSNTHAIRWYGTGGSQARAFVDNTNYFRLVPPVGGFALRTPADDDTLILFDPTGNIQLGAGGTIQFDPSLSVGSATAGAIPIGNAAGFLVMSLIGVGNIRVPYLNA